MITHLLSALKAPVYFLDVSSHLYKRVCPSVGLSIRPSVCPQVCPSVGLSVRGSVGPSVGLSVTCFFPNARKRVFSTSEIASGGGWQGEGIGREGGEGGNDEGRNDERGRI